MQNHYKEQMFLCQVDNQASGYQATRYQVIRSLGERVIMELVNKEGNPLVRARHPQDTRRYPQDTLRYNVLLLAWMEVWPYACII